MGTILKLNVMEDDGLRADLRALFVDVAKSVAREEVAETVGAEVKRVVTAQEVRISKMANERMSTGWLERIVREEMKTQMQNLMSILMTESRAAVREYVRSAEMKEVIKNAAITTVGNIIKDLAGE